MEIVEDTELSTEANTEANTAEESTEVSTDGLESCVDENQDCPSWAEKDQCSENKEMLLICKKSCGLC